MTNPLAVLIVEDMESDAQLLVRLLRKMDSMVSSDNLLGERFFVCNIVYSVACCMI